MRENVDQNNSKYGHFLRGDLMCVVNEIPRLASEFLELMTMFLLYNINAGVLFSLSDWIIHLVHSTKNEVFHEGFLE